MSVETTYTQARANFARLCDTAADDREIVFIRRRNGEDVALIAADELSSLLETAHLLRSPRNAQRLLTALARARDGVPAPQSVDELRAELGLDASRV
jgi:antitoxin YefM